MHNEKKKSELSDWISFDKTKWLKLLDNISIGDKKCSQSSHQVTQCRSWLPQP